MFSDISHRHYGYRHVVPVTGWSHDVLCDLVCTFATAVTRATTGPFSAAPATLKGVCSILLRDLSQFKHALFTRICANMSCNSSFHHFIMSYLRQKHEKHHPSLSQIDQTISTPFPSSRPLRRSMSSPFFPPI